MAKLDFMFKPREVAIIGASGNTEKIGYAVVKNIVESGYEGRILPVNPREESILGHKCLRSISEAGSIDLAVICVPETITLKVAEECGKAGVKGIIVITAGFKEVGTEGRQREEKLIKICSEYNMAMLGPNCVGLIDTHTPLNASFATGNPIPGNICFISQSGAMLISIIDWGFTMGLGFSSFVSLGNKGNLNEVDFIEHAAEDPHTKVILCYIEDVVDGERFIEVVTEASMEKPIIILKSGTSESGAQAASSHTGALAGSDTAYDITFAQSGVIRVENMDELFELAIAFSMLPYPKGDRVAIVTNSGGPGIITTDAIEKSGMKMSRFSKETIDFLRNNLPAEANIFNPIDVLGDAPADRYDLALDKALADENTDSAIVLLTPTAVTDPEKTARVIMEASEKYPDKPVFSIFMGGKRLETATKELIKNRKPVYTFPEPAVRALKGMSFYSRFLEDYCEMERIVAIEGDKDGVKSVLYDTMKDRRLVMLGHEVSRVAKAYDIPMVPIYLARNRKEALEAAASTGYPVVMKISSHQIIHKTDVGGVKLNLNSPEEVGEAYETMMNQVTRMMPNAPIYGVEIQKMAPPGIELIVGMTRDVQFGPLVAFGLGGIYVNLFEDVSFSLAHILSCPEEADRMIKNTKAYTLLRGYRGDKPSDLNAVRETIMKVALLVQDFKEIVELDINPLRAYPDGALALDVKITISSQWD